MPSLALPRPRGSARALAFAALGLAVLANVVVWTGTPGLLTFAAAGTLLWLLPGILLARVVLPVRDTSDAVERAVLGAGLGFATLIVGGLLLHYLPGPLTPVRILLGIDALLVALVLLLARRHEDVGVASVPREVAVHLVILLVVAALLRLPQLGYAQLQGDEATILLKAAAAVQGRDDVLFVHKKGPAEILIPATIYGLCGRIDETTARLPFAVAVLAGLAAVYQVGRAFFGPRAGLLAAILLALNGFFVAFARIVQYQGLVFLCSTLALLCVYRWRQDHPAARRYLLLAALFLAVGTLAHYDAMFVVPALIYLAIQRWREDRRRVAADLRTLIAGTAGAAVVLAAFYVPMVRHPYFRESTVGYLMETRVGGGGLLENTLANALDLATFYNSTYYVAGLTLLLLGALLAAIRASLPDRRGVALGIAFLAAAGVMVARPDWLQLGAGINLTALVMLLIVAVLLALRRPTAEWKVGVLWMAAGVIFYTAVIHSPRTHFHIAFPGWCLLAGTFLDDLRQRIPRPGWRRLLDIGLGVLAVVFAVYLYHVFLQHRIEYKRAYPAAHPPGYWRYEEPLPTNGWFGFPYQAGWKAIGALYHQGMLQGTYFSNEEENITDWYTWGAPRCNQEPRYYFIAPDVQDFRLVPDDLAAAGYGEIGAVTVEGRVRLRLYERGAHPDAPTVYALEALAPEFDVRTRGAALEPGLPYAEALGYVPHRLSIDLGGKVRLLGFALDTTVVTPGGEAVVTLYWQGRAPMDKDYSVFAHLDDPATGDTIAQSDGGPGRCGELRPTTSWPDGRIVPDQRAVRIPSDVTPGRYTLRVGMYDYETLERLPVLDAAGAPAGDAVVLGEIEVRVGDRG